MEHQTYKM
ncbi:hypothetical protein SOVF_124200, partial [Spinacia oleracea]